MLPYLKFPPVFGGDYSNPTTWIVLALIVVLVLGLGYAVLRLLNAEEEM